MSFCLLGSISVFFFFVSLVLQMHQKWCHVLKAPGTCLFFFPEPCQWFFKTSWYVLVVCCVIHWFKKESGKVSARARCMLMRLDGVERPTVPRRGSSHQSWVSHGESQVWGKSERTSHAPQKWGCRARAFLSVMFSPTLHLDSNKFLDHFLQRPVDLFLECKAQADLKQKSVFCSLQNH